MRKRAVGLAVAALLALVWAAPALAGEFSYGGFMRYRYITGNPGTVTDIFENFKEDKTVNLWEYRVRQFFNFKVNDHVTTNVKLEWNTQFGDERPLNGASGDLQLGGVSGGVLVNEVQFRIKNAFLRFDVPETPVTVTIGQQDFSTPKAIINVEDGTGIKAAVKAFGGEHTLFWSRPRRGTNNQKASDDADWFGVVPSFSFNGIKVSPHISYVIVGKSPSVQVGGVTTREDLLDTQLWFFGVDSSGKVGPVGFTADLIFQKGHTQPVVKGVRQVQQDIFSWIADVSGTLDVGPGALTLKALYSPGDDNATDTDLDNWQQIISTDMGWTPFFHDGTSASNWFGNVLPGVDNGGIIAFGAEFALSPVKGLTVTPNVYYLMAAEDRIAPGQPSNGEDFYGVEAGVHTNWKIWDAVNLLAQFDYLFAGDFFKPDVGDTKDAWRVVLGPSISW